MREAEIIITLLEKRLSGEMLTQTEQEQLDNWLVQNRAGKELLSELSDDDRLLKGLREYAAFTQPYQTSANEYLPEEVKRGAKVRTLIRYAAAAAVLLAVGIGGWMYMGSRQRQQGQSIVQEKTGPIQDVLPGTTKATLILADNSQITLSPDHKDSIARQGNTLIRSDKGELLYEAGANNAQALSTIPINTLITPKGGGYRIVLPDGTIAWLNASSTLKFPAVFTGGERSVEMTGEVYFEVTKKLIGTSRVPFVVKTPAGKVTVLGTRFNINAYQETGKTTTTLLEGSVQVNIPAKSNAGEISKLLTPGQKAVISSAGDQILVRAVNAEDAIEWTKGWFNFENAGVREVMQEIARWYDVDIQYKTNIAERPVMNGSVQRTIPLSQLLTNLEATMDAGLHFAIEGKTVVVTKK